MVNLAWPRVDGVRYWRQRCLVLLSSVSGVRHHMSDVCSTADLSASSKRVRTGFALLASNAKRRNLTSTPNMEPPIAG